jgi:hypothetical protein
MSLDGELGRTAEIATDGGLHYEAARRTVLKIQDQLGASIAMEPLRIGEPCHPPQAKREVIVGLVAAEAALHASSKRLADFVLERLTHDLLGHAAPRNTGGRYRQKWRRFALLWLGKAQHHLDLDQLPTLEMFEPRNRETPRVPPKDPSQFWSAGLFLPDAPVTLRLEALGASRRMFSKLQDRLFLMDAELQAASEADRPDVKIDCYIDLANAFTRAGLIDAAHACLLLAERHMATLDTTQRPAPTYAVAFQRWNLSFPRSSPDQPEAAAHTTRLQLARLGAILDHMPSTNRSDEMLSMVAAGFTTEMRAHSAGLPACDDIHEIIAPIKDELHSILRQNQASKPIQLYYWNSYLCYAVQVGDRAEIERSAEELSALVPAITSPDELNAISNLLAMAELGYKVPEIDPTAMLSAQPWRGAFAERDSVEAFGTTIVTGTPFAEFYDLRNDRCR